MFRHAAVQVGGHAHVEYAVALVGEDVDPGGLAHRVRFSGGERVRHSCGERGRQVARSLRPRGATASR